MVLLFWNEGRAVQTARSLAEGAAAVHPVAADRADPALDGSLVHVSGMLATAATLRDPVFGVAVTGVRLTRTVEMFQWRERPRSNRHGGDEGSGTPRHQRVWSATPIDSHRFREPEGHANPPMRWTSHQWQAGRVMLGGFALSPGLVGQVGDPQPVPLSPAVFGTLPAEFRAQARLGDGVIEIGDPAAAQVGDYRIRFQWVAPQTVSIVARQQGATLGPYPTEAGDRLEMLTAGIVAPETMFDTAQSANGGLTWGLRLIGMVVMSIGFGLAFHPLAALIGRVPGLDGIARASAGLMAAVLTLVLATLTMAAAWLVFRPLLAIALLVVGIGLLGGLPRLARSRADASGYRAPPPPPPPSSPSSWR